MTNVSLNQIKAFCTVAKTGSFAQASEFMHLSQPALSIAIKKLEETLGGKLLVRSTRKLSLSPEGKAFYPIATRLLGEWEQSLQDVKHHFLLLRGKLEIAAMPTYAANMLPALLGQFHKSYPDINLTVHDVIAESVVDMIRDGRCELGISFLPDDAQDLQFTQLYTDEFVAILPKQHPLLKNKTITWASLLKYPHISLQRPAGLRALVDKALSEKNLILTPTFESHQLVSIGKLVNQGLGLSIVPSTSLEQMKEMGLESRPVSSPVIKHKIGILQKKSQPLSAAAREMFDVLLTFHHHANKS